jgi:hypothetical protein
MIISSTLLLSVAYVASRAGADTCRCWNYDFNNVGCAIRDCVPDGDPNDPDTEWWKTTWNTFPPRCFDSNDPNQSCSEAPVQGVCASGRTYYDRGCTAEASYWYTLYTGPAAQSGATPCNK